MSKETSLQNLTADLQSTSKELLSECDALAKAAKDYATKENAYRMAKATAYISSEGTVDARKAQVDKITERERLESHIAEGILDSTRERVRSLRAVLSALQTIAGGYKAEADFYKTGPK